MNYFLTLVILAVCAGAYYQHTQSEQRIADLQKNLDDQTAQVATLQASVQSLTADNDHLKKSLADAQLKLTSAAAPAPSIPASTVTPVTAANAAAPAVPAQASAGTLTPQQVNTLISNSVVMVKGDRAEGTGFLVQTANGPSVITNLHVLAANPNVKIMAPNGTVITPTGFNGAADRDLALFTIRDAGYTYLPLATNLNSIQTGDEVITPGNSEGGNVVLNTKGKVLAIGPDRVEIDNPIYHGNSGGPVFDTKSGTVIGVVTEAMKVDVGDDLDKASFASRNSAISGSMRYFALRLDTVQTWEAYDQASFLNQTTFLDQFHEQSLRLDSYLNPPKTPNAATADSDNDSKLYLSDERIVKARDDFASHVDNSDTSSKIDLLRQLAFDLDAIADRDVVNVQNMSNFYSYEQQEARDEMSYRKALKAEIDSFSDDISRIGSLVRKN